MAQLWTLPTCLQIVLVLCGLAFVEAGLSDVTTDVFGDKPIHGIVAAFGDFDADKATDIIALEPDGKSVFVLEADIEFDLRREGTEFTRRAQNVIQGREDDLVITSVVPGDFTNDAQMDLLVTRKANDDPASTEVIVEIYIQGQPNTPELTLTEHMRDQPVVIDWNGDMIPDLLGETTDGKRAVWVFSDNATYSLQYIEVPSPLGKLSPLKVPQTSAFVDLDGDLIADLCVVTSEDDKVAFEFWMNREGNLTFTRSVSAPESLKVIGQVGFVDLNGNHEMNMVVPGCLDVECKQSVVFVFAYDKYSDVLGRWSRLPVDFVRNSHHGATFVESLQPVPWLRVPLALRMGDFNRDGYPDALALLAETKDGVTNHTVFLMINSDCGGEDCPFGRRFSIDYNKPLSRHRPILGSFFDFMENGALDMVLVELAEDNSPQIRAIEQHFNGDASFLKVLVASGLCHNHCPGGHKPYGVNQAGATVKFEGTRDSGGSQDGIATQLTQSAYMALQLPFVLFGLGRTPNFVDDLDVGIPSGVDNPHRTHSWSTIIPNSYVIVFPYPPDSPGSWTHELYVMPSRLVLLTGLTLLGTCAFIAVIVGLLQWRERIEDKKEKLQEAQRFHFDAM